jgi:hypothetical protein
LAVFKATSSNKERKIAGRREFAMDAEGQRRHVATPIAESEARQALKALFKDLDELTPAQRADIVESSVVHYYLDRLFRDVLGWPIDRPNHFKYELNTVAGRPNMTMIPESGGTIIIEAKRFGTVGEIREAHRTVAGVITPSQMALPGMAVDRSAEDQQAVNYASACATRSTRLSRICTA